MARSVTRSVRSSRRMEAEARQKVYDEYTTAQKLARAHEGSKEQIKLTKRLAREQRGKRKAGDD